MKLPNIGSITILGVLQMLSQKFKIKLLSIVILIPIITMLTTLFYCYDSIEEDLQSYNKTKEFLGENKAAILYSIIEESNRKSKLQTQFVKNKIVDDLTDYYKTDYYSMKRDFVSKNPNTPFYKILSDNISNMHINRNTDYNRMIIATKDGVLVDNSLTHYQDSFTSWDDIINRSPNPNMTKQAYIDITNQNQKLILIDEISSSFAPIATESDDYDTYLKSVIKHYEDNHQFDDFLNYSIVTVSYIYDTKDIFGVNDVDVGTRNDNSKIYVVQLSRIKDIIDSDPRYLKSIMDCDRMIAHQEQFTSQVAKSRITMAALIILMQVLCFFGIWYLAEFYVYNIFGKRKEDKIKLINDLELIIAKEKNDLKKIDGDNSRTETSKDGKND